MAEINIKKMILKFGDKPVYTGARTTENAVVCQGCGKPAEHIFSSYTCAGRLRQI